MNAISLSAAARPAFGKGAARKLRRDGLIPALVYAQGGEPTHISVDPHELKLIFQKSGNPNTLLSIEVDGNTHVVLVKDSQKHPVSRSLLHVDFYAVEADREVVVEVPVRTVGKSEGEKLGGRLQMLRRTVPVACMPAHIPATLDADVNGLEVGEFLRTSDLVAPDHTRLAVDHPFDILLCVGKRMEIIEEEEETEGEGEEEAAEEDE